MTISYTYDSAPMVPTVTYGPNTIAGTSFNATWDEPSGGATGYYLDVANDSGFTSFVSVYNNLSVGNVNSYAVTGLTSGNTYYYRVRAGNANGTSGNTATVAVKTGTTQIIQTLPFYDGFVYGPGQNLKNSSGAVAGTGPGSDGLYERVWLQGDNTGVLSINGMNGGAFAGLTAPSGFAAAKGNAVAAGTSASVRNVGTQFTSQTATEGATVCASFLYRVSAYPGSTVVIANLDSTAPSGSGVAPTTAWGSILMDVTGKIGINLKGNGSGNGAGAVYESVANSLNTTYLIVVRYTFHPTSNDTFELWVNPASASYGAASAPANDANGTHLTVTANGTTGNAASLAYFTLDYPGDSTLKETWDEVRIGPTWAGVTPNANLYRSHQTGNWSSISTWDVSTDGGQTYSSASSVPNGSDGSVEIQSGHTVTVDVASSGNNITVDNGGTLTVSGGILTVNHTTGSTADLDVHGTLNLSYANGNALTFGSGALMTMESDGVLHHSGAAAQISGGTLTFNGHYYDDVADAANTIPTATWGTDSTCEITGYGAGGYNAYPSGLGQSFYNFTWNCPSQTGLPNFGGILATVNNNFTMVSSGSSGYIKFSGGGTRTLNIGGNLIVQGGKLVGANNTGTLTINVSGDLQVTGGTFDIKDISGAAGGGCTINLSGNLSVASGATLAGSDKASTRVINFTKSGVQTYSKAGTISYSSATGAGSFTWTVNSGSTLDMGTSVIPNGNQVSFNVSSGGGLMTSSASGINGNFSGLTPTLSTGGNYTFSGSVSSAITGNLLPSTVNDLTINNANGVTLSQSTTVNGALTLTSGNLDLTSGALTANGISSGPGTVTIENSATLAGTGVVSGAVTVKSGGALAPGASVGTLTLGNGLTLDSGATFTVEVDGDNADVAAVTGTAAISGSTLSVSQLVNPPTKGSYKIITATTVTGMFNGLAENALVATLNAVNYYIHYRSTYVELNQSSTPVVLLQLQALTLGGKVTVRWSTSSESKTAGFDLYRVVNGQSVKLNDTMIAAKGWPNGGIGASYSVADAGAQPGQTYSYKLVERTTDGQSIAYGPYDRTVSEFVMKPLEVTAAGAKVRWLSRRGEKYRVLKSTDLTSVQYQPIAENIAATPPENEYLDTNLGNSGFYRIELQP